MILFYYVLSILVCKYTNSPIIGIAVCVLSSLYFSMTLIEAMAAFAGAVCSYQIKDSRRFWRILLINVVFYIFGSIFIGPKIDHRVIYTFVLAWGTFVCNWLGYC